MPVRGFKAVVDTVFKTAEAELSNVVSATALEPRTDEWLAFKSELEPARLRCGPLMRQLKRTRQWRAWKRGGENPVLSTQSRFLERCARRAAMAPGAPLPTAELSSRGRCVSQRLAPVGSDRMGKSSSGMIRFGLVLVVRRGGGEGGGGGSGCCGCCWCWWWWW